MTGYQVGNAGTQPWEQLALDVERPTGVADPERERAFRAAVREGHAYAARVAEHLRDRGIPVNQTRLAFSDGPGDAGRFANEQDLVVPTGSGPVVLECKSRPIAFPGDPASFPYPTATVLGVRQWDRKAEKPAAVILVSQATGAMLVVPVADTRHHWRTAEIRDGRPGRSAFRDAVYRVPRGFLRPMSYLVNWLAELLEPGPRLRRVVDAMGNCKWWTLAELEARTGDPPAVLERSIAYLREPPRYWIIEQDRDRYRIAGIERKP